MAKKKKDDKDIRTGNTSDQTSESPDHEVYDVSDSVDEDTAANAAGPDEGDDENDATAVNASAAQNAETANARLKAMMSQNFIEYASYVIKDRAIPDVDDGLKPVQRRILWAMKLADDGTFRKVATVVGDTMKFHPHGDSSIYGALVYLANKELFIEKQGNYGSIITGKPAAAMRYIECRLSPLAKDVLFNRDITRVVDSYDGRAVEPVTLPVKIPALLIMGTDGIAVGTNTKIMPHNFAEVLQAQISLLKGEPFTLYPDFLQGGIMDVSKYDDGKGKLTVRARLEIEGRNIVVKEVPATTDTERLMKSIDAAIEKNKIKIANSKDFTADTVDIHMSPIRGYAPEKTLNALYAYTDCQISISCNPMVILDNHPRRLGISEILKRNTEKLIQYLTWELQLECGMCLDKILARTLAQIFIEERIYKRIEKCKTKDAMFEEVRDGLEKFKAEWLPVVQALHNNMQLRPHIVPLDKNEQQRVDQLAQGIIPDSEIEKLVEIPIRRISAFEIDENREQIELQQKQLDAAEKNLKRIKQYAIKFLQNLLDKYGKDYPRRTEICLDGFEKIDMHKVALNNIRVGWDKKNCYIGTNVRSDDIVVCNEFDHLLCVERTGEYKIINIPEKIFIDRLYEFRKYDKDMVFGIVYSDKKSGKVYWKRTQIGQFITDREYRIIPDGCRLELITPRPNARYEIKVDTPIRAKQVQTIDLFEAPMRSPRAGGGLLSPRKLVKITFMEYLDESEVPEAEPSLGIPEETENVPVSDDVSEVDADTEVETETDTPVRKMPVKKTSAKSSHDDDGPDDGADDGKDDPEDGDLGIQPDLELGF